MIGIDDYRWLVSDAAKSFLAEDWAPHRVTSLTTKFRQSLTKEQTHLVLEQLELRHRAQAKFAVACKMFFTRKSLEQATDWRIARFKADRFRSFEFVGDLCCGIGGDLFELARTTTVQGCDKDPVVLFLCKMNGNALNMHNLRVCAEDVTESDLTWFDAWHIDPDRRPDTKRTTRAEQFQPTESQIRRMLMQNPHAAIKLAPATQIPPSWEEQAELHWIGHSRSCQQCVAFFGDLAHHRTRRSATVLSDDETTTFVARHAPPLTFTMKVENYLLEPHAVLLAAGIVPSFADDFQLKALIPSGGYLTSNTPEFHPMLSTFRVFDVMPFREKKLKSWLQKFDAGSVEVKKRGIEIDVSKLQTKLAGKGDRRLTLILFRQNEKRFAAITERLHGDSDRRMP